MIIEINKNLPVEKFNKHWQFSVGSAHATYALRKDYFDQLKKVREELGIERVRFHGIFGDDMHTYHKATDILPIPFGGGYTEQSFRQCAVAYDNILSAGMKPFVELSFMPKYLAKKRTRGMFFYKPCISPPKDYRKWYEYIQSFIRFLVGRYGEEEIRQWYFEVWNEPDLRIPFFAGTQKEYFRLYEVTARAIKDVDSSLTVGGPSTSGSKWTEEFLQYCKENKVPVDFVSTHQYAGDPLGGIEQGEKDVSLKLNIFAGLKNRKTLPHNSILPLYREFLGTKDANKTLHRDGLIKGAEKVKANAGKLPVYYTEWNMCANFSAPCNDTRMAAAYNIHAILGTQKSIDGSSIWCFSDLFEEFHQFPEEFHGGFGIMTQSGIPKPAYHALKFLNDAGDDKVILPYNGKTDVAVFRKGSTTQILLSYLEFNPTDKKETVTIRLRCDSKPEKIVLRRIDEDHANPLKEWEKIGSPAVPDKRQIRMITEASAVKEESPETVFENDVLTFTVTLSENDIYFVEVG